MMRPCVRWKRVIAAHEFCDLCAVELTTKRRHWIGKARRHWNAEQSEE